MNKLVDIQIIDDIHETMPYEIKNSIWDLEDIVFDIRWDIVFGTIITMLERGR